MRLDSYLVEKGFVESRNKAQALLKEAVVSVNGVIVTKSSYKVADNDEVSVAEFKQYVSRSANKLALFLEELKLNIEGYEALDIGSSTGGFTQVLLEHNVKEVYAVDVGKEQLHKSLKQNPKVHSFEECDIRKFSAKDNFDIVVSDVSFISLHHILDDVNRLAKNEIILLFKPQFEVGREVKRDRNGVVKDNNAIYNAMVKFEDRCSLMGWDLVQKSPSKITGKDGNLEYCYYFKKEEDKDV